MAIHEATPQKPRILSVLVENRSGVLSHVTGLFSARGFNIDSLAVGETDDATVSRITLVAKTDEKTHEQLKKQLNKLIDVIKVQDLSEEGYVDRELTLVKFKTTPEIKAKIKTLATKYRINVLEETPKTIEVECTESRENSLALFEIFKQMGIVEIARTGTVALSKKSPKD